MQIDNSNNLLIRTSADSSRIFSAKRRSFFSLLVLCVRCLVVFACMDVAVAQSPALTASELGGGEVQIAVNGQDESERQAAYRIGLRTLLQRYASRSDNPAIADSESAQEALDTAENLVDVFEYARIADLSAAGSIPVTRKVRDSGEATHIVTVQYSLVLLDQLLVESINENNSDAGEIIDTTPARLAPEVREALLWILVQDDSAEIMIGGETAPSVVGRIKELTGGVGWVSGFPGLDVVDLAAVGPETLEALDQPAQDLLLQAASRYRFPRLLAGTVARQREGNWKLSLLLMDVLLDETGQSESEQSAEQATSTIELQAQTLDAALQLLVAWMSGGLDANGGLSSSTAEEQTNAAGPGTQSAFSGSTSEGARIWFSGVLTGADYARISGFLANIDGVSSSRMLELRPDGLLFQISPRSALAGASAELQGQQWLRLASEGTSGVPEADNNSSSQQASASSSAATDQPTAVKNDSPQADLYLRYIR